MIRCDVCGKFRKNEDVIGCEGENNECWVECKDCCCGIDYERHFANRDKEKQNEQE